MSTRREFLLHCSALAATAALGPTTTLAARPRLREVGLDNLSVEAFAGRLNTVFVARDQAGGAVALRLGLVDLGNEAAGAAPAPDAQEKFSLLFTGDSSQPLPQNTYIFEHPQLGRFEMFIVPVGRANEQCCAYEAVFDRPAAGMRGRNRSLRRTQTRR